MIDRLITPADMSMYKEVTDEQLPGVAERQKEFISGKRNHFTQLGAMGLDADTGERIDGKPCTEEWKFIND